MSEEYQTVERNREAGSIGIGAMIVFIALILVAAVASTIIIKTAEELQQNAESTSDDTRKEISGKVNIIQIIVNGSSGNDIDSLIVTAKIASGSTDVQVQDIEWAIICGGSNGFGLVTGNLGTTDPAGGQILAADKERVNADKLDGSDYTATSGTLTISAGSTSGTFNVPVLHDTLDEANETATITLSNASNATISDSTATLTITDDDATPSFTIADVTTGNENAANHAFTVSLSAVSGRDVAVDYATSDGTATAGADNCLLPSCLLHSGQTIFVSDTELEKTSSSNKCPQLAHW